MLLPVDQLVALQASRDPDRTAVVGEDGRLTYRQVAGAMEAVRSLVERAGVAPGDTVGVLVPRLRCLPAALLGVLRAGAAYLPLDPIYPPSRIEFMLRDAGARVALSTCDLASLVPSTVETIAIDNLADSLDSAGIPGLEAVESESRSAPDSLAYVIYTSGSTGVPKGVEVLHSSLALFRQAILERIGLLPSDRVLAPTTICFDISILELLVPLTTGAAVVISSTDAAREARALSAALERERITVLQGTPTFWRLVVEGGVRLPAGLRKLCGGEMLPRDLAERLLATGGELWNLYGPTEATIWCTADRVSHGEGLVPIGRPLSGYSVAVVDEQGMPVPPGGEGEIWIGGGAIAQGYRNRPELTAERFVVPPWGEAGRLYRSGDLGRWRPDGALECLGRRDEQVKIDGYRVELGEIERALEEHPAIARAVVTKDPDTSQLVAYVLESARGAAIATALRMSLQARLPLYMVPSRFFRLSEVPVTPNGKVDRVRLPGVSTGPVSETSVARRAVSPVEQRLHLYWQELLGTREFGIDDDYFALGGRSLAAARLFARIESEMGVRLPIATLLTAPTIARLARVVEAGAAALSWSPLVCLQAEGSGTPFFLVHPLGGNVITYRVLAAHLGRDRPIYGLQAAGLNGAEVPMTSVEAMAALYLRQIREIAGEAPLLLGGASFGGLIAFEMARQAVETCLRVGLVAMFDTDFPDAPGWASGIYARSPFFREGVYPQLQRARSHMRAVAHRGVRRYWAEIVRGRAGRAPDVVDDPRDAGGAVPDVLSRVSLANQRAERHYIPRPFPGRLTLFRATDPRPTPDCSHRWAAVASAGVEIIDVPGNHYTMRVEPNVSILAAALTPHLRVAEAPA